MFKGFPPRALVHNAAVALLALAGSIPATVAAMAADLDRPRYSPPPEQYIERPYANLERWTGFYLGGTVGSSWGQGRTGGDIGKFSFDQEGTVGTLFAGYNWQFGRAVLGAEADIGTGNTKSTTLTGLGVLDTDLNYMGSFRARAGFLMTPALLVYATGGLAWQNTSFTLNGLDTTTQTLWGTQVGVGSEFMISRNVGLRVEYLYTDFGRESVNHAGFNNRYDPENHTVRAGISFKF